MSKDKRNPSQKIEDLEQAVFSIYQTLNVMGRDLEIIKEAIKLLGTQANASMRAAERGIPATHANVDELATEIKIEGMIKIVKDMISNNIITPSETITEESFVVGRDLDKDDSTIVTNPRNQFAMQAVQPEARAKLIGLKAGDVIQLTEGYNKLEVLEVYQVGVPTPAAEVLTTEAATEVPALVAPEAASETTTEAASS